MDTVSDLMTPEPVVVAASTSIAEAARMLVRLDVRHLPVVDAAGAFAGVLTDAAVFDRGAFAGGADLWMPFGEGPDTAGVIAEPIAVVAAPDDGLVDVLRRMLRSRQDVVVVVDADAHPIGIVTEHDGVRLAQDALPAKLHTGHEGSYPLHAVPADLPLDEARQRMRSAGVRHLVVTEGRRLAGVVSYRDLLAWRAPGREVRVRDVLGAHELVRAHGDVALARVAKVMTEHKIGCVPVVDDDGRPVRIVTRTDVLYALVSAIEQESLFSRDGT